jgi:L-amino acid N-acyltransferase YncA
MDEGIRNGIPGQENQEQLSVVVELATKKDWEAYKKLRLEAIGGKYQEVFGAGPQKLEEESRRTPEEWQDDLSREDMFVILAWDKEEPVGMARALEREKGIWRTQSGYVVEKLQNQHIGRKLFAARILEIKKRGAGKVSMMVEAENERSIHLNEKLGFRKTTDEPQADKTQDGKEFRFYRMEMDLTDEIIRQAEEILR